MLFAGPTLPAQDNAGGPPKPDRRAVLESKGYIVPASATLVVPLLGGKIVEYNVEEGVAVTKGTVLARLDATEAELDHQKALSRVKQATALLDELKAGPRKEEIEEAAAALAEIEEQLKQSRNELRRLGNASESDIEKAKSAVRLLELREQKQRAAFQLIAQGPRKERVNAAQAALDEAKIEVAKAKFRLDAMVIRSPITGTILTKKAEQGTVVQPLGFNVPAAICEMADLTQLEVDLSIQERDIRYVFLNQPCTIRPEAFPETTYQGRVSRVLHIADRAKGAIPVRVRIDVPKGERKLWPEMAAIVRFLSKE
jgi:multidrug resistance efflux pump